MKKIILGMFYFIEVEFMEDVKTLEEFKETQELKTIKVVIRRYRRKLLSASNGILDIIELVCTPRSSTVFTIIDSSISNMTGLGFKFLEHHVEPERSTDWPKLRFEISKNVTKLNGQKVLFKNINHFIAFKRWELSIQKKEELLKKQLLQKEEH